MPKDRLNEFLNKANIHADDDMEITVKTPFKFKKEVPKTDLMEDMFKEINEIRSNIADVKLKVEEVKKLHTSILSSPSTNEASRNVLDETTTEIRNLVNVITRQLKEFDLKVKEDEKTNTAKNGDAGPGKAAFRMKKLQHSALMQAFRDVLANYSECQGKYRAASKQRIERTLQIANKDMTENEIEDIIEGGNMKIFAEQYLESSAKAKLDLQELEVRHQELTKLEKNIKEMKDLFVDLSILIDQQGETLDRIENHFQETKDVIESSVKQTQKALVNRRKSQKKRLCIIGCIVIALLILTLIITLSVVFRS